VSKRAHICIGGPLDGEFACSDDFYGGYEKVPGTNRNDYSKSVEGMYEHLKGQYQQFNTAHSRRGACNVIWLHTSLMKVPVSPRAR